MPTTVSPPQPPECPPSKCLWATNRLSFRPSKVSTLSPLSRSIFGGVDVPAQPPEPPFFTQRITTSTWWIVTGPLHPTSTKFVPLRSEYKKLSPTFIGPFVIDSLVNPVSVCLKLPRNMRLHNVFSSKTLPVQSFVLLCPSATDGPSVLPQIC